MTGSRRTGAQYPVRVFLYKDEVMVTLDTSGDSLHKRGYRLATSKAPLTETLAASLIMLTPMACRQNTCGSVLWQWYISDRGSHDGSKYSTRYEQGVYS